METPDLQKRNRLFPPINRGEIREIYPWNDSIPDILDCILYPFKRIINNKLKDNIIYDFFQTKNIFLLDSGRSAIFLALKSLEIKNGDEVILTAFNCPAVIEPILAVGATPKFVDINSNTCGIDLESFRNVINQKTKCIIVTNIYGVVDMLGEISNICKENNIFLINDLSQVLENSTSDQKFNKYGDVSVYSFGPEKQLFALGGGAILSNDQKIFEAIKQNLPDAHVSYFFNLKTIINRAKYYLTFYVYKNLPVISSVMALLGITLRFDKVKTVEIDHGQVLVKKMNSLQRSILIRKLKNFSMVVALNIENFNLLSKNLRFTVIRGDKMVPLYATIILGDIDRFDLSEYLSKKGIMSVWNYLPLYKAENNFTDSINLPNTEKMWRSVLSIPFRYPIKKSRIINMCEIINSYDKN